MLGFHSYIVDGLFFLVLMFSNPNLGLIEVELIPMPSTSNSWTIIWSSYTSFTTSFTSFILKFRNFPTINFLEHATHVLYFCSNDIHIPLALS